MNRTSSPHDECYDKDYTKDLLFKRHRTHFTDLFFSHCHRFRGLFEFRIDQAVQEVRRNDTQDKTRDNAGHEPGTPADRDTKDLLCQRITEHVVRGAGQKNAGRCDNCRISTEHQECTCTRIRSLAGIRAKRCGNTADNRVDDTATTGCIRRSERSNDEVRCAHDISNPQGAAAELRQEHIGDTLAQPGLDEAFSKHEGRNDQPDRGVGETCQRLAGIHDSQNREQCAGDQCNRTNRHRLQDEACDRSNEYSEQAPGLRPYSGRCRNEPDDYTDGHAHEATDQRAKPLAFVCV